MSRIGSLEGKQHSAHDIGATALREEPLYIPTHIEKQVIYQHAYHCTKCEMLGETKIKKVPAYRQEKE